MRLLLPPSETKRDGGDESRPLDLSALSFPELTRPRTAALRALARLARNLTTMSGALKLGPAGRPELMRNRAVRSSPTMPALERYTGVLFDAIDVPSLTSRARRAASDSVVIHSALFGLVRADDPIPAYRLSHDSRLPDVRLGPLWREPVGSVLAGNSGLTLDLRSEAYAALGPLPAGEGAFIVRIVAAEADGSRRALTHFGKRGKGEFVRALLESGVANELAEVQDLLDWAESRGIRLAHGSAGELELTVDEVAGPRSADR